MAIKNVASSPVNNPGLGKAKDSDSSKGALVAELANASSISQAATGAGAANKNYGVELSDRAKTRAAEQRKSFDIAKNTPDVREDRVAQLKAKIESGSYQVDSGKIADGMLREAIMEHLATDKDN
ncbi:MAG: flagellar biosynthesis anti-sigma factor FlgM [Pseudomonadota bacterium]